MEVRIVKPEELLDVSMLSLALGNIPFFPDQSIVSVLTDREDGEILGFAAVQTAHHAAGSWVKEALRRKGYSYQLRRALDDELRRRGIPRYFALPGSDFEKQLFAKYGRVSEQLAQVRQL